MTGSSDVGATIALFAARADRSDEPDMGIDVIAKKKISLAKKRNQRAGVDQVFRRHLRQNCQHYLHGNRPATTTCFGVTSVYYGFVSRETKKWGGK